MPAKPLPVPALAARWARGAAIAQEADRAARTHLRQRWGLLLWDGLRDAGRCLAWALAHGFVLTPVFAVWLMLADPVRFEHWVQALSPATPASITQMQAVILGTSLMVVLGSWMFQMFGLDGLSAHHERRVERLRTQYCLALIEEQLIALHRPSPSQSAQPASLPLSAERDLP